MNYASYSFMRMMKSEVLKKCRTVGSVMFNKYLFITNVGISVTLSGTGDVIQQHYEILRDRDVTWDKTRTFNMSASGLTVGIVCHHLYKYLDRTFPGRAVSTVLKKVLIDQLVSSPLCIGTFFATLAYLEGASAGELVEEVRQKGWRLYFADCAIWPPAQVVNFYFVPPHLRVLYDNTISLGFDVYFSYVKNQLPLESNVKSERT
ncbi:mpv17-like protein 2 [Bacillus rossius redtenbacheri]|uniref:mpv17-like protein 2 n=1 Tax=Bacillus rossius redtenbacheri TaxID=93214 RepID=UPI002FDD4BDA